MPKAISITINTDDVLKAADLGGFTVTQAEASRWLRENAWAIEEHVHHGLYDFMADTMRLDFPEGSLRKVESEIDSAVSRALNSYAAANRLELAGYSFSGEILAIVRRFREDDNATADLILEVGWKRGEPTELGVRIRKDGGRYSAELQSEVSVGPNSSVQ
jgi:hypothetical protein